MKSLICHIVLIVLPACWNNAFPDDDQDENEAKKAVIDPLGFGDIRPKFFQIKFNTLPAVQQYPYGDFRDVERFESNRLVDAKLTLPIVLKDRLQLLAQVRYKNELLNLGEIEGIYDRDIKLKNTGISFLYKIELKGRYFVAGHIGGSLKSDSYLYQALTSILDYNTSFLFGWENPDQCSRAGMGVVFGNSMGRFNVLPVLVYDRRLNNRWLLEMKLPKRIQFRRVLQPDRFYLLFTAEATGAAYALRDEVYPGEFDTEFRRASIDFSVGLEREIYDWLWFGAQAGGTQPLRSLFVRRGQRSGLGLHHLSPAFSPYASISLFAVPPRSLFNRSR